MSTRFGSSAVPIQHVEVSAFTIPTSSPESDGTLEWDKTTIVIVQASAGGREGIGYTYADEATAKLISSRLAKTVEKHDAMNVGGAWQAMVHGIRNLGRPASAQWPSPR